MDLSILKTILQLPWLLISLLDAAAHLCRMVSTLLKVNTLTANRVLTIALKYVAHVVAVTIIVCLTGLVPSV